MKAAKWQRTVSLLLCLLMAMSFFVITTPEAYAAEPAWPYLESIDEYKFGWFGLRDDFTANLKKIEIQQASSLTECTEAAYGATTTYHAGTIYLYVDNIPTDADKTKNAYGFTFEILTEGSGSARKSKVTLKNVGEGYTERFYGENSIYASDDFKLHDGFENYILTAEKIAYDYDVQVVQYTGEAGEELTLSDASATRTSKEAATVKFSASAEGTYYYALYDVRQTAPVVVDVTASNTNTGTMAKTNTITISGMTDCKTKYLYIVGVDASGTASAPLEIVIPGIPFELKHDKQGLRGFTVIDGSENVLDGWLYTEEFKDASGNTITKAVPGEKVTVNFGAFSTNTAALYNGIYYDESTGVIGNKTGIRQHVLKNGTLWA